MAVQIRLGSRIAVAILGIFISIASPAHAQTASETCGSTASVDDRIAACTQVLQDRSSSASDRASAYVERGIAYRAKGEYDLAIADYSEALRIDPNDVLSYANRGNAYRAKGQNDLAMADYNQALRIDPNYAIAYHNRGRAFFGLARFTDSGADFGRALLDRTEPYAVLWLHIARVRAGEDDSAAFAINAASVDRTKWPAPVVEFFLGKTTAAQTLASAHE